MANTYQGPAVVIFDGVEYPAEVDFEISVERNGGVVVRKSWDGYVDSDPTIGWFSSPTAQPAIVRMPDGREGRFHAGAGTLGSGRVEIRGTGPAPFGDA
jgi:hypothetical protein